APRSSSIASARSGSSQPPWLFSGGAWLGQASPTPLHSGFCFPQGFCDTMRGGSTLSCHRKNFLIPRTRRKSSPQEPGPTLSASSPKAAAGSSASACITSARAACQSSSGSACASPREELPRTGGTRNIPQPMLDYLLKSVPHPLTPETKSKLVSNCH